MADDDPPDEKPPTPLTPPTPPRQLALVAGVLIGAVLVLGLIFVFNQGSKVDNLEAERDERLEVSAAAGRFAEALFTYSFDDLTTSRDLVLTLVTDELAASYQEGSFPGLEQIFGELQLTTTAQATDVFVTEVGDATAAAVVGVNLQLASTATTEDVRDVLYLRLALEEVDGEWLVNEAKFLLVPQSGAQSTTTTAPPAG